MSELEVRPLETGGMAHAPVGIGGWLILPPFHLLLDIGLFVWLIVLGFRQEVGAAASGAGGNSEISAAQWTSLGFVIFTLALAVYAIYCLVRFLQKQSDVPRLMTVFYVLVLAKAVANIAILHAFSELQATDQEILDGWTAVAQSTVAAAVWISYFRVSVRVKNTFVR